jgi:hypothetical protein
MYAAPDSTFEQVSNENPSHFEQGLLAIELGLFKLLADQYIGLEYDCVEQHIVMIVNVIKYYTPRHLQPGLCVEYLGLISCSRLSAGTIKASICRHVC